MTSAPLTAAARSVVTRSSAAKPFPIPSVSTPPRERKSASLASSMSCSRMVWPAAPRCATRLKPPLPAPMTVIVFASVMYVLSSPIIPERDQPGNVEGEIIVEEHATKAGRCADELADDGADDAQHDADIEPRED